MGAGNAGQCFINMDLALSPQPTPPFQWQGQWAMGNGQWAIKMDPSTQQALPVIDLFHPWPENWAM